MTLIVLYWSVAMSIHAQRVQHAWRIVQSVELESSESKKSIEHSDFKDLYKTCMTCVMEIKFVAQCSNRMKIGV